MADEKKNKNQAAITGFPLLFHRSDRLQFFLIALITIFIVEGILMGILSLFPSIPDIAKILLDALLLPVILFLLLWPQLNREIQFQNARFAQAQETLRKSEERYKALVESTEDSIYLVNRECCYVYLNKNHLARLGFSSDEFLGRPYSDFHTDEETHKFEAAVNEVFATEKSIQQEHQSLRDGRYFLRTLSPIRDNEGKIAAVSIISKQITGLKRMQEELRKLSITDELTGLYNRRGFMTFGKQQLKIANRLKRELLLISADLDELKKINDTMGHQEGDQALVVVATILMDTFRSSDIIARIGGDEFVALQMKNPENSISISSDRLQEAFANHNMKSQKPYKLSLSLGTVVYNPHQPKSLEELLAEADARMYMQKKTKNPVIKEKRVQSA